MCFGKAARWALLFQPSQISQHIWMAPSFLESVVCEHFSQDKIVLVGRFKLEELQLQTSRQIKIVQTCEINYVNLTEY